MSTVAETIAQYFERFYVLALVVTAELIGNVHA